MAQGHRPDRVGDQIRQEISDLLARGAVHDPGIGFITLTRVQVSADLQVAHIFYTMLGDEKALKAFDDMEGSLEDQKAALAKVKGMKVHLDPEMVVEFKAN